VHQLVIDSPRALRLRSVPEPTAAAGEALVQVGAAGICGSDIHGYAGTNGRRPPGTVMGHEAAGRVLAVGEGVDADLVGRLVAINPVVSCGVCPRCLQGRPNICDDRRLYGCTPALPGAFAQQLAVRAGNLVPLPDGAAIERAALVEPLSVGARAASLTGVGAGGRALVIGGGPIGIAAALAVQRAGAEVLVSEPDAERRTLLAALGLPACAPADAGDPVDAAIDCVGFEQTVATAIAVTPPGGTIVWVGLAGERIPVDAIALVMGERRLVGSAVYTPEDFAATAAWAVTTTVPLELLVQRRATLAELPDVFAGYSEGSITAVKTLVEPDAA
jgi:L-iditol 2-dehydrogenase